jgi:Spy/CpxP family protein refolding chaperone
MRMDRRFLPATLLLPLALAAQGPPAHGGAQAPCGGPPEAIRVFPPGGGGPMGPGPVMVMRGPAMGEWWKNSELAQKLKLTDQQTKQLSNIFYQHRLKLIDDQAEVEKQDLELQNLLDEDNPNEKQVGARVDRTLAARAKLEREFTMMNLALRKTLTLDQWKQLKAIQSERMRAGGNMFFWRFRGGPEGAFPPPMPPPPPPDPGL